MYNDNGTINQAIPIDPFNVTNVFMNYTIKSASGFARDQDPTEREQSVSTSTAS